jgi:adenylosuccinate synthase
VSATSVVGLQWGDEAKGKIVDLLTDEHDVVVRYQGGNNAGHTVVFNGQTYKLSQLPAGILHPRVASVIATGVVINPAALLKEMDSIAARKGPPIDGNLLISDRAHVIFPYHALEEAVLEKSRKGDPIGTTMRGIGPCYCDKAGRTHAVRMGDLKRPDSFRPRLAEIVAYKNVFLRAFDPDLVPLDVDKIYEEYMGYAERLRPFITDTTAYLHQALREGKRLLFEGAQGSLLDVDHGTFPFVTSSNSSGCGVHNGSGVSERVITKMIGVVKAYSTRVGGGPFATELNDEIGQQIRDVGHEYGTVTGRPRRCGWFDGVAAGYGARLSGVDSIAIALLDVLSGLKELKICTAYEIAGKQTAEFPSHVDDLAIARPVYRTLPGWMCDISNVRRYDDFPAATKRYIETVAELVGSRVEIVSVGPDRDQTVFCKK